MKIKREVARYFILMPNSGPTAFEMCLMMFVQRDSFLSSAIAVPIMSISSVRMPRDPIGLVDPINFRGTQALG